MARRKVLTKVMGATVGAVLAGSLFLSPPAVHAASSSSALTSSEAQAIIAHAEQIKGIVQYHYGVNNPSKMWFDCSSFTKYLFQQEGITLRWGARLQYADGVKIAKSQLKPGDLVFFSTPATANNATLYLKIEHVGIYIGNGEFIHNVNAKYDVEISNLNTGYWNNHYLAAVSVKVPNPSGSGSTSAAQSGMGTVVRSVSFLNSPSLKGARIRYLQKGETFTILNQVNKYWYHIKDKNGTDGYVTTLAKYVSTNPGQTAPSQPTATASSSIGSVVHSVSFRTGPSLSSGRIRYLQKGETFTILNQVNKYWYQIKDKNGKIGYVTTMSKYVSA